MPPQEQSERPPTGCPRPRRPRRVGLQRRLGGREPTAQRSPKRRLGSVKVTSSWWALKSSRNESSGIRRPSRRARRLLAVEEQAELRRPIPVALGHAGPSGRNHQASGSPVLDLVGALEELAAANTGWSRRSPISVRMNSCSSRCSSSRPQSNHETRCPGTRRCCCRAGCGRTRRRRAASACPGRGTAWRGSSAAGARAARISGSSVGPSTPQFHERLSSVPSWLSSRLASLCLSL